MLTAYRTWLAALTLVVATLFSAPAQAQSATWTFLPGAVLSPQASIPWASQSIGAPSVAYDSIRNRYMMMFETRLPGTDANCPQGLWGLGLATSPDGITWTINPLPIIAPNGTNGNYWECVAAHPAAVFVDDGVNGHLQVYFKAEQGVDGCPSDPASCQYSGIGRLRVNLDASGAPSGLSVQANPPLPFSAGQVGGFPRVVQDAGTYVLAVQRYPDIHVTSSIAFTAFPPSSPVVTVAQYSPFVSWVQDEFFSPTLVCDDSRAFPFAMFLGGRDTSFASIKTGAMAKAISSTPSFWALSTTPDFSWSTNNEWRHWDVQRLTTGDYLIWFSEKDGSGNNFIRFGGTTLSFNIADTQGKVCP
jgi:hypothetical protein